MNKFRVGITIGIAVALLTTAIGYGIKPVVADVTPTVFLTPNSSTDYPASLLNPGDGNFYAQTSVQTMLQIHPNGTTTNVYEPANMQGLTYGPDNNLWGVGNQTLTQISEAGAQGLTKDFSTAGAPYNSANSYFNAIMSGPNGHLWIFSNVADGTTPGQLLEVDTAGNILNAYNLNVVANYPVLGPDGNFWFSSNVSATAPTVEKITPSGVETSYPLNSSQFFNSNNLILKVNAHDNSLWSSAYDTSGNFELARISMDGTITTPVTTVSVPSSNGLSGAAPIVADSNGNIWAAGADANNNSMIMETSQTGAYVQKANLANQLQVQTFAADSTGSVYWLASDNYIYKTDGVPSSGGNSCTSNAATNTACATVAVGAGSLIRLNAPDVNYAAISLNGQAQITNANVAYQVRDATGSGNGWNMTLSATTFTDLSNTSHTLPNNALSLNAPSGQVCITPGCTVAMDSVGGPIAVATAPGSGPTLRILNATANTGMGSVETDTSTSLAIPASAYQGSYSSTWTLSLTSGP